MKRLHSNAVLGLAIFLLLPLWSWSRQHWINYRGTLEMLWLD